MPIVTDLVPDARGSGGFTVHLDGASYALVGADDVRALGLAVGGQLEGAAVAALDRRSEVFAARATALRILSYRALPAGEIERRLVRKGHLPAVAGEVVAGLVAAGLIDDVEFARHFARTRARRLRFGPGRLTRDLRRLGIGESAARHAVEHALAEDGVDTLVLLREAAEKKLRGLAGIEPAARRRRLKAYLLRRGFAATDVRQVVKEALPG
jgi:regulatory protein